MPGVRSKLLVVTALVAGLALTGCAQDASEALRVGDVTVDNAEIEATADPFAEFLNANGADASLSRIRQAVAEFTIFTEVARQYAREEGITLPTPDYESVAASMQTSPDDPFVRLNAEVDAYRNALLEETTGRTPTEDEMRGVYDDYVVLAGPQAASYDEIRTALLDLPEYGQALALRDELLEAMDRYGLSVSPRYQPLSFALFAVSQGQLVLVSLPLGEQGTGAVRPAS
jgi:hypothetical protein